MNLFSEKNLEYIQINECSNNNFNFTLLLYFRKAFQVKPIFLDKHLIRPVIPSITKFC